MLDYEEMKEHDMEPVDAQTNQPAGNIDEWVKSRLAEMGLEEGDIDMVVEGGGGLHSEGGRWKICPSCKANIDMLTWVKGEIDGQEWPRLLARAEIECPNCGAYGETFGESATNEPHPKLKTYNAREVHNPFPWAARYIKVGKAIVEKNGLFPADPKFDPNEPYWPRDLAACIIGAALVVSSTIKRVGDTIAGGEHKGPRARVKRNVPRRPQQGNNYDQNRDADKR